MTMTKLTNISLWDVPLTGLPANFHRLTALSSLGCYIRVVPESVFRLPNHRRFNIYASNKLASNIEALNDLNLVPTTTRSGITYYTRCAGTDISLKHLAASAVVRHKLSTAGLPSDLAELLKIDTFPTAACSQCSRTVSSWIEVQPTSPFSDY